MTDTPLKRRSASSFDDFYVHDARAGNTILHAEISDIFSSTSFSSQDRRMGLPS